MPCARNGVLERHAPDAQSYGTVTLVMSVWTLVGFVTGVVALVSGAEWLIRGASALAARFGISPIVIGLTVVAFGTSAPELAVSIGSAVRGEAELALGNVLGSNISNILLILGSSAAVASLTVHRRLVRRDVPVLIAVSGLSLVVALDREIGRLDGFVLTGLLVTYLVGTAREARRPRLEPLEDELVRSALAGEVDEVAEVLEELEEAAEELEDLEEEAEELEVGLELAQAATRPVALELGLVVAGLVLLVVGSQLLVSAATDTAVALGVSDLVIGLTVVAVGTSLPEFATSVLAAARGERDLAVGNVIGSNLFNLLAVLGLTAAVAPSPLPVPSAALSLDFPLMLVVTMACLPVFVSGYAVRRWEGALFVGFYVLYVLYLVLDATETAASAAVGLVGLAAGALALATFATMGLRSWWSDRAAISAARSDS